MVLQLREGMQPNDPALNITCKNVPFDIHVWADPADVDAFAEGSEECPDIQHVRFDPSGPNSLWNLYLFHQLGLRLKQVVAETNLPPWSDADLSDLFRDKYQRGWLASLKSATASIRQTLPDGRKETQEEAEQRVNLMDAASRGVQRRTQRRGQVSPMPSCSLHG